MSEKQFRWFAVGIFSGMILGGMAMFVGVKMDADEFHQTHQCVSNERMDEIMAVFFYCQGYYEEAQEWWNSPVNGTSANVFSPTMNFTDNESIGSRS